VSTESNARKFTLIYMCAEARCVHLPHLGSRRPSRQPTIVRSGQCQTSDSSPCVGRRASVSERVCSSSYPLASIGRFRSNAAGQSADAEHGSPREHSDYFGDAMPTPDLTAFVHEVDGRSFAGWFRHAGSGHIEVLGIGLLQTVPYPAHVAPANVARQTLARFVRGRQRKGLPIPSVEQIKAAMC